MFLSTVGVKIIKISHFEECDSMKYNLVVAGGGLSGVAAEIAHKTNATTHTVDIKALQQKLKDNGAVI